MIKNLSIQNTPRIYGNIVERLKATSRTQGADLRRSDDWSDRGDTSFLIASAQRRDGRTTTAIGLATATAVAKPQQRVLLVDLDHRRGGVQRLLGARQSRTVPGIVDVIQGRAEIAAAAQPTALPNLHVIFAGKSPLNVPEDCQSAALRRTLAAIADQYDYAFFDSPAMNEHVDARLLSELMDRVVLVVRSDRSKKEDVLAARRQLPVEKLVGAIVSDCRHPVPSFLARRL